MSNWSPLNEHLAAEGFDSEGVESSGVTVGRDRLNQQRKEGHIMTRH